MKKQYLYLLTLWFSLATSLKASAQYCTSNLYITACSDGDNIESFSTSGGTTAISNLNSGCGNLNTGYTYYAAQTHTAVQGSITAFTVVNNVDYDEEYRIWVDWNADGDFTDAGEQVYSGLLMPSEVVNGSFAVPFNAVAGTTRLRVRCVFDPQGAVTPCGNEDYGEVEDYNFEVVAASPCSGTPTTGIASSTASAACVGQEFDLSLSGNTQASGLTLTWQSSPAGQNNWSAISGASMSLYTVSGQGVATDYRAIITCTNPGGGSDTSNIVSVSQNTFTNCYCSPSNGSPLATIAAVNDISNVSIAGTTLNAFSSSTSFDGYTLVPITPSSNTATLNAGSSYTLSVAVDGFSAFDATAWIDYNQDGVFSGAENIPLSFNFNFDTASGTFTVPASVLPGNTGLRVSASEWDVISGPCDDLLIGEAEQYTITITTGGAVCTAPGPLSVSNITTSGADFSWPAVAGAASYDYSVTTSINPPPGGTATTALTASIAGLAAGTVYYLHVRTDCGAGGVSGWTTTMFTTLTGTGTCVAPATVTVSGITASGANFSWSLVTGAAGYEYEVSTSPTPSGAGTQTGLTTAAATSLAGSTTYYIHVRTNCGGGNNSSWTTQSFTTLPTGTTCFAPASVSVSGITSSGATLNWTAMTGALGYEYAVTTVATPPASGTSTSLLTAVSSGLAASTAYFVHVRTDCGSGNFSAWTTQSFTTLPASGSCIAPAGLAASSITSSTATVTWGAVSGAAGYEYAFTLFSTPPSIGTLTTGTTAMGTALIAGNPYYAHVRTVCGAGVFSAWSTLSFTTLPPTAIGSMNNSPEFNVSPNPFTTILRVNGAQAGASVEITDVSGRVVKKEQILSVEHNIDASSLLPGLYLMRYRDDRGDQTLKLIKSE